MANIEERHDITGKKFSRITVIKYSNKKGSGRARYWECKCDCGNIVILRGSSLKDGTTKSCGCLNTETRRLLISGVNLTHGMSNTKEFNAWRAMIGRCNNKKNKKFHRYGGRGIKVCKRWTDSFINFFADMGNAPTKRHSLDRVRNNRGYYKSNCRWATGIEQANNTSTNRKFKIDGKIMGIIECSRYIGVSYPAIVRNLGKGLTMDQIKIKFEKLYG